MKRSQAGFSLTELMVAVGLSTVVVTAASTLIYGFIKQHNQFRNWTDTYVESQIASDAFNRTLRNSTRLEPPEDMLTEGDRRYYGLTDIPTNKIPAQCSTDQSVVRVTSYERNKQAMKLLRSFSETDAGKSGSAHALRVNYDEEKSPFNDTPAPTELIIIDADNRSVRRFRVKSFQIVKNSENNPYDNLPVTTPSGEQKLFNYVQIDLDPPQMFGTAQKVKQLDLTFITGSPVFVSKTVIFCQDKSSQSIVKIDTETDEVTTMLQSPVGNYDVTAFDIKFAATKAKTLVLDADFKKSYYGTDENICINAASVGMTFKPRPTSTNDGGLEIKDEKEVRNERLLFLNNFNIHRPSNCF